MQKRGAAELVVILLVALASVGVLYTQFASTSDPTGLQTATRLRTVPRGVPPKCQSVNSLMIKISRDLELTLDKYESLWLDIDIIIKLKQKVLKISNTKLKSAVLTCSDWFTLVPGLNKALTCGDIDEPDEDEKKDIKLEGKTCKGSNNLCVDRFPYSKCEGPGQGGDKSLNCDCESVSLDGTPTKLCVPPDKTLWIFQKNVWKMKKIVRKLTIKLSLSLDIWRELHIKLKQSLKIWIKMDGDLKSCIRDNCITDCPQTYVPSTRPRTGGAVRMPEPRTAVTTPREPQISTPREQAPQDCETVCGKKGMSTSKPSSSSILSQLQQYRCVSGASIKISGTRSGNCTCYGKAQISINKKKPICKTKCGPVECDGQASCPCPDKPNCTLTVKCTWGGWKEIKAYQYAPVMKG